MITWGGQVDYAVRVTVLRKFGPTYETLTSLAALVIVQKDVRIAAVMFLQSGMIGT